MAGVEAAVSTNVEDGGCGPVMQMMNKRLRALKKKMNRILQIEEAKSGGKAVNKEQEDVLKSKAQVAALMEEYERLRQPLLAAVKEEVLEKEREWAAAKEQQQQAAAEEQPELEADVHDVKADEENAADACDVETSNEDAAAAPAVPAGGEEDGGKAQSEDSSSAAAELEEHLAELIHLVYFAQLFDVVQPHGNLAISWTTIKFHERASCLSYDQVTDDDVAPLDEADLDALAAFGSFVMSRPPNNTLSHKEALQNCIAHARNWLLKSDQPIDRDFGITYAELRERLHRILGTDYYTMTPELQTVPQQITDAAAEHYASKSYMNPLEVPQEQYVNGADSVSNSAGNISDSSGNNADVSQDSTQVDTPEALVPAEETRPSDEPQVFQKQPPAQTGSNGEFAQPQQQQQQQQQQRFRGRGGGYGRGRGYSGYGGRGGRGNRGGPGQNGRQGQFYEQSGYYQQKNYYSGAGAGAGNSNSHNHGRRGRGYYSNNSNNNTNNVVNNNAEQAHANGPAVAAQSG